MALVSMTLFAFTQCGSLKVSKEYKDVSNLLEKCEKSVKKASSCEDLKNVTSNLLMEILSLKEYECKDKMNEKEEEVLLKRTDKIQTLYNIKASALGCEEEE